MNKEKKILNDIIKVSQLIGKENEEKFGRDEYLNHPEARYSKYDIYDNGKDWNYWAKELGFNTMAKNEITDDEYFSNLQQAINHLGRFPKVSERKNLNLNFSKRRWSTLNDFIHEAINNKKVKVPRDLLVELKNEKQSQLIKVDIPEQKIKNLGFVPPIPVYAKRNKWERTNIIGFPYSPQDESGVIALFAIMCVERDVPYEILELNSGKGVDGILYDLNLKKELFFELKYILSKGSWNHPFDSFDILICWESKWLDFPKPVLELKELLKKRHTIRK